MCLIVFAVQPDEENTLLLAGNRDEFHDRPTDPLGWWADQPRIVGGRDARAGGTWLAASRDGRFATVTNSRDARAPEPGHRSRGLLVTDFLESQEPPMTFLERVDGPAYAGFNLIVSDGRSVAYSSNRGAGPQTLERGVYAVSNAVLDTPWHKVEYAKDAFLTLMRHGTPGDESLLALLANDERAPVESVQASSLPAELAHAVTAPFIVQPIYGTRSTSVVRFGQTRRRFDR